MRSGACINSGAVEPDLVGKFDNFTQTRYYSIL